MRISARGAGDGAERSLLGFYTVLDGIPRGPGGRGPPDLRGGVNGFDAVLGRRFRGLEVRDPPRRIVPYAE